MLFFFSSGRRHTSSKRDWSSDVCSSDLQLFVDRPRDRSTKSWPQSRHRYAALPSRVANPPAATHQIGRASCRERVKISMRRVSGKKKLAKTKQSTSCVIKRTRLAYYATP